MDVRLHVEVSPADYRGFEDREDPLIFGDVYPCPALKPSTTRLIEIVDGIKESRPALNEFSILVRCAPDTDKIGHANWELLYPAIYDERHNNGPGDVELIPLTGRTDFANCTIGEQHRASACCLAIRQLQSEGWEEQ
jgi:hypothetical protein